MSDNPIVGSASNVDRKRQASVPDRMISTVFALLDTAVEMARMLSYRSDLYRSRQQLRELSDEMLRDVGLTRRQAENEAKRPYFEE